MEEHHEWSELTTLDYFQRGPMQKVLHLFLLEIQSRAARQESWPSKRYHPTMNVIECEGYIPSCLLETTFGGRFACFPMQYREAKSVVVKCGPDDWVLNVPGTTIDKRHNSWRVFYCRALDLDPAGVLECAVLKTDASSVSCAVAGNGSVTVGGHVFKTGENYDLCMYIVPLCHRHNGAEFEAAPSKEDVTRMALKPETKMVKIESLLGFGEEELCKLRDVKLSQESKVKLAQQLKVAHNSVQPLFALTLSLAEQMKECEALKKKVELLEAAVAEKNNSVSNNNNEIDNSSAS